MRQFYLLASLVTYGLAKLLKLVHEQQQFSVRQEKQRRERKRDRGQRGEGGR